MQVAQINNCMGCIRLRELYQELNKRITLYTNNHRLNEEYNLELPYPEDIVKRLLHYKRIVFKRLFNPFYPHPSLDGEDLLTQVSLLITQ